MIPDTLLVSPAETDTPGHEGPSSRAGEIAPVPTHHAPSDESARLVAIDPLLQLSLMRPDRLVEPDPWVGHIPFAFWLVGAARPRVLVELGTHSGNSYAAFCQAITTLRLDTAAYAVDTWQGDEQAGLYGEEVYDELRRYHESRYAGFSRLVRSTFDEALTHFPDGSIDLLHIDGYHTYDAAKHDFETWLPKLSPRGIVLFHDINVRERDFGAWQVWLEVAADRPAFSFLHHHGLGVLGVGPDLPPTLRTLFRASGDADACSAVRGWFAAAGRSVQREIEAGRTAAARRDWQGAHNALREANGAVQAITRHRDEIEARLREVTAECERLQQRLTAMHEVEQDRARLAQEVNATVGLRGEIQALTIANENAERACGLLRADLVAAQAKLRKIPSLEREVERLRVASAKAEERLKQVKASPFWKLGAPFRKLAKASHRKS